MKPSQISRFLLKRKPESHKGDFGHLLVIGGNESYTGAPYFVGMSALRTGCDLVTVAAPERSASIIAAHSADLITHPLGGPVLTRRHVGEISGLLRGKTAAVIGNGLGKKRNTLEAVAMLINAIDIPCVIDGDAIDRMEGQLTNFVLTPHEKEFQRFYGKPAGSGLKERAQNVKEAANKMKTVILLKGRVDIISDGTRVETNRTGNPFMTKGGTGDVLAGILGSLLAQGMRPFDAAVSAAYINGKAGDITAREKRYGLLASDVILNIPKVL